MSGNGALVISIVLGWIVYAAYFRKGSKPMVFHGLMTVLISKPKPKRRRRKR